MKTFQAALYANRVPRRTVGRAVLALLFLGVIAAASGCELIYLPQCSTDCNAAGGNDAYSRGAI